MPFTDINTAVCATVRKLRNIYLKGRNEEVEISRYGLFIGSIINVGVSTE